MRACGHAGMRACGHAARRTVGAHSRKQLKMVRVSILVHPYRRVGSYHRFGAERLLVNAIDLCEPRVAVEVEVRDL